MDEFIEFYKGDGANKIVNNPDEFEFLCTCKEAFNKYDKNGDGKITLKEWMEAMKEAGRNDQEAKQLFSEADKDNDKIITFDEFYKSIIE